MLRSFVIIVIWRPRKSGSIFAKSQRSTSKLPHSLLYDGFRWIFSCNKLAEEWCSPPPPTQTPPSIAQVKCHWRYTLFLPTPSWHAHELIYLSPFLSVVLLKCDAKSCIPKGGNLRTWLGESKSFQRCWLKLSSSCMWRRVVWSIDTYIPFQAREIVT
jgi:hypothetical protein